MDRSKRFSQVMCMLSLMLLLFVPSISLASGDNSAEQQYVNKGNEYYEHRQFGLAIKEYTKAIGVNDKFFKAYYNRAMAYLQFTGQQTSAITDLSKAIEVNPQSADAYFQRARLLAQRGWDKAAIVDYDAVIQLNPKRANAYFNKAMSHWRLKEYQKAIEGFEAFLQYAPSTDSFISEAKDNIIQVRADEAKDIDKQDQLADAERLVNQAQEDVAAGNYSEAIEKCDQASDLNKYNAGAYACKAIAQISLHRYKESIAETDKVIALLPQSGTGWNTKGKAYLALRDYKNALAAFQKAAELEPDQSQFSDDIIATKQQQLEEIKDKYPVGSKVQVVQWPRILGPAYGYAGIVKGYSGEEVELEVCAFINVNKYVEAAPASGGQNLYRTSGIGTTVAISPLYITGEYNGPLQSNIAETSNTSTYSADTGYQIVTKDHAYVFITKSNLNTNSIHVFVKIWHIAEDNNYVTAVFYDKNGNVSKSLSRATTGNKDYFTDGFMDSGDRLPVKAVISYIKDDRQPVQVTVTFNETGAYVLTIND
ncbi:MAG: tetratricopeptide repeat protein [Pelosinus sp.]|nr:tetratricopeptide repeat protein [Pelosinus sp.]